MPTALERLRRMSIPSEHRGFLSGRGRSTPSSSPSLSFGQRLRALATKRINLPRPIANIVNNPVRSLFLATALPVTSATALSARGAPIVSTAGGRLLRGAVTGVKKAFQPTTLGRLPAKIGAGIIGTSLPFIAYDVVTAKSPLNFVQKLKGQARSIAGLGINPLGGIIGEAQRGSLATFGFVGKGFKELFGKGKELAQNAPPVSNYFPEMPSFDFPDFNYSAPEIKYPDVNFPSISLGGGGGGLGLDALLLALGLGGGYLLGRKRRKKKYKKARRHRKK